MNVKDRFLSFFKRWGHRVERSTMDAYGEGDIYELRDLALMSLYATRTPIEFGPPGPKFTIIMSSDIDPKTGKLYKNFQERRRKLREQRERAKGEILAGCPSHDVRPD
jgi:hypothetical protein